MDKLIEDIKKSFTISKKHVEWLVSPCPAVLAGRRIKQQHVTFRGFKLSIRLIIFVLINGRLPVGTVKFADGNPRNLAAKNVVDALTKTSK